MDIRWDAESDNISGLKQSLSLRTQALTLAISKADRLVTPRNLGSPRPLRVHYLTSRSRERGSSSRERLEKRLKEVFDCINTNLNSQGDYQESSIALTTDTIRDLNLVSESFSFQLFRGDQPIIGEEECLLFPEATLESLTISDTTTFGRVFGCLCSGRMHAELTHVC
jgi:hypothetical protein